MSSRQIMPALVRGLTVSKRVTMTRDTGTPSSDSRVRSFR
jgi:hypothetical protein